MLHGIPERLDGLCGNHRFAATTDRGGDGNRQENLVLLEDLLNRHQRRLGVQRVEDCFHEEEIRAAFYQGADLIQVCLFHLIKSHHAKARVVRVGRVRERHRQRSDGAGHEALPAVLVRNPIRPLATLARRGFVDLPRQIVEELVLDDLLVELGILAPAVLARVVHEELALADAGGGKSVGLNDVRTGFEEAPVDVADHRRLCDGEKVAVVEQVLPGVLEPVPADIGLFHPVGADGRAHRAIENGNSLPEEFLKLRAAVLVRAHSDYISFLARCNRGASSTKPYV